MVAAGTLGREAQRITVAADLGAGSRTSTSPGWTHDSFRSTAFVSWENLLDDRTSTLSHEYGHAWSLYYAYVVQQVPAMSSYLRRAASPATRGSTAPTAGTPTR